ncbi:discoidin domain-containing protein [Dactylosporangium sp. NPDC050588]|uniref:discoidin domain-containing protein n=1 Tax=Dactylosporangium sp. NPDC050588 TaxID=3157211 RepID=UPI0033C7D993
MQQIGRRALNAFLVLALTFGAVGTALAPAVTAAAAVTGTDDFTAGPAMLPGESADAYLRRISPPKASLAKEIAQVQADAELPGAIVADPADAAGGGAQFVATALEDNDIKFCERTHDLAKATGRPAPWYYGNRFFACQVGESIDYLHKECEGAACRVIARSSFRLTAVGLTGNEGRTITWKLRVDEIKGSNPALWATAPLTLSVACVEQTSDGGECKQGASKSRTLAEWELNSTYQQKTEGKTTGATGWDQTSFSKLKKPSLRTDPKVSTFEFRVTALNTISPSPESGVYRGPHTTVRCDEAQYIVWKGPGGCVFDQVRGIMQYDYTGPEQESVFFFYQAYWYLDRVKKNPPAGVYIPGNFDKRPITFMTRNVYEMKKRSKVPAECIRQNGGKNYTVGADGVTRYECDEIPFNSTYEAAPFVDDTNVNTKATWAAKIVKADDNSDTGEELGAFYREDRILSKDKFVVEIKNAPATCAVCESMPPMGGGDIDPLIPLPLEDPDTDESFTDGEPALADELPAPNVSVWGDPHLATLDGLQYDLQSVGEFDFAESEKYGMKIQTRFASMSSAGTWSGLDAVAAKVGDHRVEFTAAGAVRVDGKAFDLPEEHFVDLGGDATLRRTGGKLAVAWGSTSDTPVMVWLPGRAAGIGLHMPADAGLRGLLGNADKNPKNDLKLRDGTQLAADASPAVLHGAYADSWRISQASSLFTYQAGQSTASFTDKSYPKNVVTINTLTASEVAAGTEVCTAHGVAAGPQFEACVVDVVLTSNNEFAAMAAQRKEITIDPRAATVTAAGDLSVDFEGATLPSNLAPAALTNDAAATSFAGPFSGRNASYRMYTQQLPAHLKGSLSFDVVAVGNWAGDGDVEKVSLQVDRKEVWSQAYDGTVTPQRTGTLANGQPFAVYQVTVPLTHRISQLEAVFTAAGVDGLANQGFGIDNIALHVDPVAPQVFDVTLPATIGDGVPAAGAGTIETLVSRDEYRISVKQGEALYVDTMACLDGRLDWQLVDEATGAAALTGGCAGAQTGPLTAGTYRLVVRAPLEYTGTYRMAVSVVPAPQRFDVSLPLTVGPDARPGEGAGDLETKASADEYRFTLTQPQALAVSLDCLSYCAERQIVNEATGAVITFGYSSKDRTKVLPAGTYRLVVRSSPADAKTGPYGLEVTVIPPAQTFDVQLPFAVSDGVPAAGAGNLEARASVDEYRFTLPAAQEVYVDTTTAEGQFMYRAEWTLVNDATGARVEGPAWYSRLTDPLPAGKYRLVVDSSSNNVTRYGVRVKASPPQRFDMTLPIKVDAGAFDSGDERDEYRFTLAGTQTLRYLGGACWAQGATMRLTNTATGAVLAQGGCREDRTIQNVPAGSYALLIAANGKVFQYGIELFVMPAPQSFDVAFPVRIADGVPAPGAGNMETRASVDEYRFTLPTAQALYIDVQGCSPSTPQWRLLNDVTGEPVTSYSMCSDERTGQLPAGRYRLVASAELARSAAGTYGITITPLPPAQQFTLQLPGEIRQNAPGAGAGNLEDKTAVDEYRFHLADNQLLYIDAGDCAADPVFEYRILTSTGDTVLFGGCSHAQTLSQEGVYLEGGDFTLSVRSYEERSGTYTMKVRTLPTQRFAVTLPLSIRDGAPVAGAGRIEPGTTEDAYTFRLGGGETLHIDAPQCPAGLGWQLVRRTDQTSTEVGSGGCATVATDPLPYGDYTLFVFGLQGPATYKLNVATTPPDAVRLTATSDTPHTVQLEWTGTAAAAQTRILRNGNEVAVVPGTDTTFTDRQVDAGSYTYQVQEIGAAGAAGEQSDTVSVGVSAATAFQVNHARCGAEAGAPGCTYTTTVEADPGHPDTGGRELTDGAVGDASYTAQWQGRNGAGSYHATVDLGAARNIREITTGWLQARQDFVFLPNRVTYSVSEDGEQWTQVAAIDRPAVDGTVQRKEYRGFGLDTRARYVRVDVDGGTAWSMLDEIGVWGFGDGVSAPVGVTAIPLTSAQQIQLTWTGSGGAVRTDVYRDGERVAQLDGGDRWFGDPLLEGGRTYTYQLAEVDGAGNSSAMSEPVTATLEVRPAPAINLARCGAAAGAAGCAYTTTSAADPAWPDTGGTSLTDGQRGGASYGPRWQGRNGGGSYSITVDLGSWQRIDEISTGWLQAQQDFVFLPEIVFYQVSDDGQNWLNIENLERPNAGSAVQRKAYRATGFQTSGRYVRVEVDGGTAWSMLDEIEILGADTPAAPAALVATPNGADAVTLDWTASGTAQGYFVYRDGEMVGFTPGPQYVDRQVDPGRTYRYTVSEYSIWGRYSDQTTPVPATTAQRDPALVNHARGRGYTTSVAADPAYPDTGGTSLTDGQRGALVYDARWQGRNGAGTYSVMLDLGTTRHLRELNTGWLAAPADGVALPGTVTYSVSTDGETFTEVGTVDQHWYAWETAAHNYRLTGLDADARYVKVTIEGGTAWSMTDELEVYGTP